MWWKYDNIKNYISKIPTKRTLKKTIFQMKVNFKRKAKKKKLKSKEKTAKFNLWAKKLPQSEIWW